MSSLTARVKRLVVIVGIGILGLMVGARLQKQPKTGLVPTLRAKGFNESQNNIARGDSQHDNKHIGARLQFEALLAEYKMLRDLVATHRQMQGQLTNMALTGLGFSIPFILVVLDRYLNSIGVILLLPILFFAIAFVQLWHERIIILNVFHVDSNLHPQINALLSQTSKNRVSVFEYERYMFRTWSPSFLRTWVATVSSQTGISLAIGVGLVVVYLYLQLVLFGLKLNWSAYETWLLAVNLLILLGVLGIAFRTARMRYKFYRSYLEEAQADRL